MLTRFSWLWLCAFLCACSGLRCGPDGRAPAHSPAPPADLRLLLLTDPKGYLEPCGCQQRPLGGVGRLASALGKERAGSPPSLLLAVGDLLQGMEIPPGDEGSAAAQEAWRAETLADVWHELGMAAAAPGPLDLALPDSPALAARGGFPWLIENATMAGLPLARGRVFEAGTIKVGVFGLLAPDPGLPGAVQSALDAEALGDVAARASASLRAQGARVVVALVTGDRRAARELAGHGADVVVMGGLDAEQPVPPALVRGSLLVHAGRQGQRLLSLDLALGKPDDSGPFRDESTWTREETARARNADISELAAKIAAWEKDGSAAAADLAAQRARLQALRAEAAQPAVPSYAGRWFDARITVLSPDVPEAPGIAQRLDAYDVRVNEHNRTSLAGKLPLPAAPDAPHFVGSEACKSCHEPAYAWWKGTPHGNAYATLERVHKEFNLSCVGCHVTGYNRPGGSTVTHVESLKNVGCESCHGPGSQHVQKPDQPGLTALTVPEATCRGCHTPEHSDRFAYDTFRKVLMMPGHGQPPSQARP